METASTWVRNMAQKLQTRDRVKLEKGKRYSQSTRTEKALLVTQFKNTFDSKQCQEPVECLND